jgi:hypothetical protein
VDEPGPETRGAMGDGPAATVAMSRATWAAVVVRVCGRCGVVGGLVRDVGGSNRDVGGPSRVLGGSDRSGVDGTAAWAAGWWILHFGDGLPFPSPTMAGNEANGVWRAVSESSSPAPGGRLVDQQPVGGQEV